MVSKSTRVAAKHGEKETVAVFEEKNQKSFVSDSTTVNLEGHAADQADAALPAAGTVTAVGPAQPIGELTSAPVSTETGLNVPEAPLTGPGSAADDLALEIGTVRARSPLLGRGINPSDPVNVEAGLIDNVSGTLQPSPRPAGGRPLALSPLDLVTSAPLPVETGLGVVEPVQADIDGRLREEISVGHVTTMENDLFESHVIAALPKIGAVVFVLGHEPGMPPVDKQWWPHVPAIVTRVHGYAEQAAVRLIDATVIPPDSLPFHGASLQYGLLPGNWCWPEHLDAVTRLREAEALRRED